MSPPPVGGHLAELSEVGHQLVCKEPQQAFGISPPPSPVGISCVVPSKD